MASGATQDIRSTLSGQAHASLDEVHVDLGAHLHAVLELVLVVALCSLRLDVLLDCVDLRLVLDQLLLDVVQPVVDLVSQDLVLLGVVLHRVVSNLLREADLVHLDELLHLVEADLLPLEVRPQLVGLGELVAHVILHIRTFLLCILHLVVDTSLQRLHFLEVVLDLLFLNLETGCRCFCILHLVLLELEVTSHVFHLLLRWQLVLPLHCLLHVLKKAGDECLALLDLLLVVILLLLKLLSEFIDLLFFLVQDLVLLLFALSTGTTLLLEVVVDLFDVLLVLLHRLLHFKEVFVHLLELSVVLLDPVLETFPSLRQRQVHFICLKL